MCGKNSFPNQGDIIWIDAEPYAGKEYGGHNYQNFRRPMLVISGKIYNENTGMIVGFPITSSKVPGNFPSGLKIKIEDQSIHGYAILGNLLGYDFQGRHGKIVGKINNSAKRQALQAIKNIFDILIE
jgi:mRNA interferase MazF